MPGYQCETCGGTDFKLQDDGGTQVCVDCGAVATALRVEESDDEYVAPPPEQVAKLARQSHIYIKRTDGEDQRKRTRTVITRDGADVIEDVQDQLLEMAQLWGKQLGGDLKAFIPAVFAIWRRCIVHWLATPKWKAPRAKYHSFEQVALKLPARLTPAMLLAILWQAALRCNEVVMAGDVTRWFNEGPFKQRLAKLLAAPQEPAIAFGHQVEKALEVQLRPLFNAHLLLIQNGRDVKVRQVEKAAAWLQSTGIAVEKVDLFALFPRLLAASRLAPKSQSHVGELATALLERVTEDGTKQRGLGMLSRYSPEVVTTAAIAVSAAAAGALDVDAEADMVRERPPLGEALEHFQAGSLASRWDDASAWTREGFWLGCQHALPGRPDGRPLSMITLEDNEARQKGGRSEEDVQRAKRERRTVAPAFYRSLGLLWEARDNAAAAVEGGGGSDAGAAAPAASSSRPGQHDRMSPPSTTGRTLHRRELIEALVYECRGGGVDIDCSPHLRRSSRRWVSSFADWQKSIERCEQELQALDALSNQPEPLGAERERKKTPFGKKYKDYGRRQAIERAARQKWALAVGKFMKLAKEAFAPRAEGRAIGHLLWGRPKVEETSGGGDDGAAPKAAESKEGGIVPVAKHPPKKVVRPKNLKTEEALSDPYEDFSVRSPASGSSLDSEEAVEQRKPRQKRTRPFGRMLEEAAEKERKERSAARKTSENQEAVEAAGSIEHMPDVGEARPSDSAAAEPKRSACAKTGGSSSEAAGRRQTGSSSSSSLSSSSTCSSKSSNEDGSSDGEGSSREVLRPPPTTIQRPTRQAPKQAALGKQSLAAKTSPPVQGPGTVQRRATTKPAAVAPRRLRRQASGIDRSRPGASKRARREIAASSPPQSPSHASGQQQSQQPVSPAVRPMQRQEDDGSASSSLPIVPGGLCPEASPAERRSHEGSALTIDSPMPPDTDTVSAAGTPSRTPKSQQALEGDTSEEDDYV
eukprot:TRINITY_DN35176_c0_g1_i1.p1 TRINITY_DN35176_c0_g1~~TRINITY_DN35176_c0_g1_i1.p1  ORF type:complete len:981 (-),score=223.27 TRINITY_DN35176_c0_g1_i1:507-3449(-)